MQGLRLKFLEVKVFPNPSDQIRVERYLFHGFTAQFNGFGHRFDPVRFEGKVFTALGDMGESNRAKAFAQCSMLGPKDFVLPNYEIDQSVAPPNSR